MSVFLIPFRLEIEMYHVEDSNKVVFFIKIDEDYSYVIGEMIIDF